MGMIVAKEMVMWLVIVAFDVNWLEKVVEAWTFSPQPIGMRSP